MNAFVWTLIGFLLGSIPFSVILGRVLLRKDIRQYGDGNPGGTNVARASGSKLLGALAIVIDMAKGALPVALAYYVFGIDGWGLTPVMLAPILGHAYSPVSPVQGRQGHRRHLWGVDCADRAVWPVRHGVEPARAQPRHCGARLGRDGRAAASCWRSLACSASFRRRCLPPGSAPSVDPGLEAPRGPGARRRSCARGEGAEPLMVIMALSRHRWRLLGMLGITLSNLLFFPRLRTGSPADAPAQDAPLVSVLVPARNEAAVIEGTVRRLLAQTLRAASSWSCSTTTRTTARATWPAAARAATPGCASLAGRPCPPGWAGKNWACHQLSQAAAGRHPAVHGCRHRLGAGRAGSARRRNGRQSRRPANGLADADHRDLGRATDRAQYGAGRAWGTCPSCPRTTCRSLPSARRTGR